MVIIIFQLIIIGISIPFLILTDNKWIASIYSASIAINAINIIEKLV